LDSYIVELRSTPARPSYLIPAKVFNKDFFFLNVNGRYLGLFWWMIMLSIWVAVISAKKHKRQRRKR